MSKLNAGGDFRHATGTQLCGPVWHQNPHQITVVTVVLLQRWYYRSSSCESGFSPAGDRGRELRYKCRTLKMQNNKKADRAIAKMTARCACTRAPWKFWGVPDPDTTPMV